MGMKRFEGIVLHWRTLFCCCSQSFRFYYLLFLSCRLSNILGICIQIQSIEFDSKEQQTAAAHQFRFQFVSTKYMIEWLSWVITLKGRKKKWGKRTPLPLTMATWWSEVHTTDWLLKWTWLSSFISPLRIQLDVVCVAFGHIFARVLLYRPIRFVSKL